MVCDSCQSKLSRVCVPDKWRAEPPAAAPSSGTAYVGAGSDAAGAGGKSSTTGSGSMRPGSTNKLLAATKQGKVRPGPDRAFSQRFCRICKCKVLDQMNFCNDCAHSKGGSKSATLIESMSVFLKT
jgi:hypothetical protein